MSSSTSWSKRSSTLGLILGRSQDPQEPPQRPTHRRGHRRLARTPRAAASGDGTDGLPLPAGRPRLRHGERHPHKSLQPSQPILQTSAQAGVRRRHPSNLRNRSFKPLLRRAFGEDGPDICFHDLRHTCATLLLSQGTHPKLVQELLGHATIAMTLDTYSHFLPSMGEQTVKAMEAALS
jgi:integrase